MVTHRRTAPRIVLLPAMEGLTAMPAGDMVTRMKTTIDIADTLFESTRAAATREGTTFRALVEEGLRLALGKRRGSGAAFRLRDASFKGKGVQPGVDIHDWASIARHAYEGRGG